LSNQTGIVLMISFSSMQHAKQSQRVGIFVSTRSSRVIVQNVGRREDCDDDEHDA
jgi:hypothetical protein